MFFLKGRLALILVSFFFIALIFLYNIDDCINELQFEKDEYSGAITDKFIDSLNHNAFTLMLNQSEKLPIMYFSANGDKAFYDYVCIGDSLIKPKGQSYFKIIKSAAIRKFYVENTCI